MSKTLRAQALKLIQKLARISAADDNGYCECWSCHKKFHYKDMDGGHYYPKGSCSYWALEKENVHPQCKGCNGFGMKYGTAAQQYTLTMIDYYGRDFVDDMESKRRNVKKIYKADYEEMIKEFNSEINYHLERIGECN
jgi:hypothetical protein